MTVEALCKAYEYGVNYGLYLAETERDSEDMFDTVGCFVYSRKMCVPSSTAKRRQPRSEAWREVMGGGQRAFLELCVEVLSANGNM